MLSADHRMFELVDSRIDMARGFVLTDRIVEPCLADCLTASGIKKATFELRP